VDGEAIREHIRGKVVMVTGAAGSIGSELCRQIAGLDPMTLVGFDQAETPLYLLDRELQGSFPGLTFHSELGTVTRFDQVCQTLERYRPSIVYHAAGFKHVSMMERDVFAAVENNIFGTWQVARAASSHGVESFVFISTDKAVRPANVMGASKRIAEQVIRALEEERGTRFLAVRLGNVLGSSGSVLPIFQAQIAHGGPVTVTHAEMERYFMTACEAAQLVLEASALGGRGETYILDMGAPVRILDLARKLIRLSGMEPGRDIEIEFTGIRPGEKLLEELNLPDEFLVPTPHAKIMCIVSSQETEGDRADRILHALAAALEGRDETRLLWLLKDAVPDYIPAAEVDRVAAGPCPEYRTSPSSRI
jgi:FlaA1/EpsC-like NDP-sugar epimerase